MWINHPGAFVSGVVRRERRAGLVQRPYRLHQAGRHRTVGCAPWLVPWMGSDRTMQDVQLVVLWEVRLTCWHEERSAHARGITTIVCGNSYEYIRRKITPVGPDGKPQKPPLLTSVAAGGMTGFCCASPPCVLALCVAAATLTTLCHQIGCRASPWTPSRTESKPHLMCCHQSMFRQSREVAAFRVCLGL